MRSTLFGVLTATLALAIGCDRGDDAAPQSAGDRPSANAPAIPATVFVETPPAGARGVGEIKADESLSGEVVVRGRIAGREEPFVKGAAMFLITDTSIKPCNELHGDLCPTPWDHCCESPDSLAANTATVQIVDDHGKPLRVSVEGQRGLKPLATLTIAGEIADRAGGSLVINARKIHVAANEG